MKKILIVFLVVFIANLGCKKLDDGDRVCACSPLQEPAIVLVVKSAAGSDLLNPTTAGYFSENQVQLYQNNADGSTKKIAFYIRPTFSYGNEKFSYYQIHSSEIISLASSINQDFYLKLGNTDTLKINIEKASNSFILGKLLVNQVEKTAETGSVANYLKNIYYIDLF